MLKKSAILCAALLLPAMAQAAVLVTTNNTSQPSTVRVAYSGVCVGTLPPGMRVVTAPHSQSVVAQDNINLLCGGKARHTCTADIHMTENCSDAPVATAVFNLDSFSISSLSMRAGTPYNITASGTNVVINPA